MAEQLEEAIRLLNNAMHQPGPEAFDHYHTSGLESRAHASYTTAIDTSLTHARRALALLYRRDNHGRGTTINSTGPDGKRVAVARRAERGGQEEARNLARMKVGREDGGNGDAMSRGSLKDAGEQLVQMQLEAGFRWFGRKGTATRKKEQAPAVRQQLARDHKRGPKAMAKKENQHRFREGLPARYKGKVEVGSRGRALASVEDETKKEAEVGRMVLTIRGRGRSRSPSVRAERNYRTRSPLASHGPRGYVAGLAVTMPLRPLPTKHF